MQKCIPEKFDWVHQTVLLYERVLSGHETSVLQLLELVTYWISATEDTVLVQSGTKALVCAATSVTVLPCEEEAKTSHDGVVLFIRKLFTIAVEKATIKNIEHL